MEGFKTPLPVPEFYTSANSCYSTKKARRIPNYRRIGPPALTMPAVKQAWSSNRFRSQKPRRVSFGAPPAKRLSVTFYNYRKHESYFKQCFIIESKIGEGCYGKVYKARSREDNRLYAVKKAMEPFRGEGDRAVRLLEVQKHESLPKHPNLLKFVKAWEERGCLYIQTELCKISLSELCETVHDIPESLVWKYLVDLLLAVKHLHDHDLVHMDIKPENILISKDGICKLGDFGLICDLRKELPEDVEGDSKYLAPEVLQSRIGKHVDIFSLGITILEISSDLDLPSEGETWHMLRQGNLPESFLAGKSLELCNVIRLMTIPDESKRPTAAEILSLPSVAEVWRWRRQYVSYCQINNMVKSCLLLMWSFFTFFGNSPDSFKTFLIHSSRRFREKKIMEYDSGAGLIEYDDEMPNGCVTAELKLDSTSSDECNDLCEISAIDHDDHAINGRLATATDLLDDVPMPEFCSCCSTHGADQNKNCQQEKTKNAGLPVWNSTPASEGRMRRRIVDMRSPNDLKRLRSEAKFLNFTSSPVRSNHVTNADTSGETSILTSLDVMQDLHCSNTDAPLSPRNSSDSRLRPVPWPKNLVDAFSADSENEIEF